MDTSTHLFAPPDLGDDQFIGAVCGLRPCREGGVRLEIEPMGTKHIVHNYGHGGCGVTISLGTAEIAANLVDQIADRDTPIAVLGAGVVGLTTARELLMRGYSVSIYAQEIARNTTSMLAGALWLHTGLDFGDSPREQALKHEILIRSRAGFRSIDRQRFGVEELPVFEPAETQTDDALFADCVIEPPIQIDAFPFPCHANPGRMFTTDFIHTPRFLDALVEEITQLGGEFHQRTIGSREELLSFEQAVLVNCMAMSSDLIFDDDQIYSARGVLVHMKPQRLGYCIHDGYKYMFPREDALILGGCFQDGRLDDEPDEKMVQEILTHHRRFFDQF